jgi:SAM-dependent methyltransferase
MSQSFLEHTAESYDRVAAAYVQRFQHELDYKPFDRKILELLVEKVGTKGPICDMGCGPGHIAAYVHQLGAAACGIDLSAQMVAEAQRLHPDIPFQQGDMLGLKAVELGAFGGVAAFYSIIHIPRPQVVDALRELKRVLRQDGRLLVTFHIGSEIRHLDTFFEQPVNLDFAFFETQEMKDYVQAAGLTLEEVIERDPYPEEVQTRRAYLFARKRVE